LGLPVYMGSQKRKLFLILRIEFGWEYRDGRRNFCRELAKKSWSKRWPRLFLAMLCPASTWSNCCATPLAQWSVGAGGRSKRMNRRCIGYPKTYCVLVKRMEVWGSLICTIWSSNAS
jgi:hypothetical protein